MFFLRYSVKSSHVIIYDHTQQNDAYSFKKKLGAANHFLILNNYCNVCDMITKNPINKLNPMALSFKNSPSLQAFDCFCQRYILLKYV